MLGKYYKSQANCWLFFELLIKKKQVSKTNEHFLHSNGSNNLWQLFKEQQKYGYELILMHHIWVTKFYKEYCTWKDHLLYQSTDTSQLQLYDAILQRNPGIGYLLGFIFRFLFLIEHHSVCNTIYLNLQTHTHIFVEDFIRL